MKQLTILLCLALSLALAGCGAKTPEQPAAPVVPPTEAPGAYRPSEDERITRRRTEAREAGAFCAVAYLGFAVDALSPDFSEADVYAAFPEYEGSVFIDAGGENLFVLIPTDPEALVWIDRAELTGDGRLLPTGGMLYAGDDGAPVILRCNESDIVPNVVVRIEDSEGWGMAASPSLSLRDGSVSMEGAYDFTKYPEGFVREE